MRRAAEWHGGVRHKEGHGGVQWGMERCREGSEDGHWEHREAWGYQRCKVGMQGCTEQECYREVCGTNMPGRGHRTGIPWKGVEGHGTGMS